MQHFFLDALALEDVGLPRNIGNNTEQQRSLLFLTIVSYYSALEAGLY